MPIQPYSAGGGGGLSKIMGIIGGAKTGASVGGPYGAVVGGILGAKGSSPGGQVAKIGMNQMSPMQRRMDTSTEGNPNDKQDPIHQQKIDAGLEALDDPNIPQSVRDQIAPILIAGKTHGPYGYSTDHLFSNEPGQSYSNEAPIDETGGGSQ